MVIQLKPSDSKVEVVGSIDMDWCQEKCLEQSLAPNCEANIGLVVAVVTLVVEF